MQIIHKIDDFFYTIFPEITEPADKDLIISTVKEYYTYGPYQPKVTIEKETIIIDVDTTTIIEQISEYKKAVALSEKGKFTEAIPILEELIKKNPTNSEYYRILGQIFSEQGDQEEAINYLIDSLRWDAKNGFALLMMGNIFARYKDDFTTAMKYYDQALISNVTDYISLNNIGYVLMQQGKLAKAKKYLWQAIKINDQYPNTHLALGILAEKEDDLHSAFYSIVNSIKLNKNRDVIYENSIKHAFELAQKIIKTGVGKNIFIEYKEKLETQGGVKIEITEDSKINTPAKIEFAENYDSDKHVIRYKRDRVAVEHLIMHELVHLDFVIEARKEELNQLFVSTQNFRKDFIKGLGSTIRKLQKIGLSEDAISNYCKHLFDGLNLQIYNSPIDLFIEDFLYDEFPDLRPYQFLSLYSLNQEGLKAVTDKKVVEISPNDILSKSKIYNIVNAIQLKRLFGVDFIKDFKATTSELKYANDFYSEYLEYKEDKEPAEEYELILHWAEDLKLDKNFELINEKEYRTKRTDIENLLSSIETDPYDLESKDPYKEREMEKFQKSQEEMGTNMAVVMFMVDALQFFDGMSTEKIKKIALEIAMYGTQGYHPEKKDYKISLIPNKDFSGYHILAYYYVSWALAIPEMFAELQLPYDEEYKLAASMYKTK